MRLGNVYDSLPAGVSRADYRAISNFVVNELSYPVMESMVREPTGDTNRVIHGGYVYNFHERRCCSKTPHRVPYYLGGSDVYVYRCSQRNIHKRSQKSDNFNKTRNRWVRVDMHCQGHINVYFPSPEQGRLRQDVYITYLHHQHAGLGHRGVPDICRQWIVDHPQSTIRDQRLDLLSALSRGDLPGVDPDVYISAAHIRYWWRKGQRHRNHISDDSWVNLEHTLRQDPNVHSWNE